MQSAGAGLRGDPVTAACVVRSKWRLVFWSLWSTALFVVAFLMVRDGDLPAVILCVGAVGIVVVVWWPRLVVGSDGIEVRNLRTVRLRWREVKDVTVKRQLPFMGRFWNAIYLPKGIGPKGFP